MDIQLLPNQEKIYRDIISNIPNTNVVITGLSGCGKTEILKKLFKEAIYLGYTPILFECDKNISVEQYYPMLAGLNQHANSPTFIQITSGLSQDSPVLPHTLYLLQKWLWGKAKKNLDYLNETEKMIFDRLSYLVKNNNLLILCDNIQYWDTYSLNFLNLLFQDAYLYEITQKIKFVISFTTDQDYANPKQLNFLWIKSFFMKISFSEISYKTFVENLYQLGLKKNLKSEEFHILYHLIGNHIQIMLEIVQEINGDRLDFDKLYQSNIDLLKPILLKRLEQLGTIGAFIDEALKYASLMGIQFDKSELAQMLTDDVDIYITLKEAENIHLIKEYDSINCAFVHEIIMKVFEAEIPDTYKPIYYLKIESCLKCIKPHDYLRRAYCFVNAHRTLEAERIFSLYLIQHFKENSELSEMTYSELKSHINTYAPYIAAMKQAYNQYHKKDYTNTFYILFSIPDIYPEDLLAEKNILVSSCQTKILETESKQEAIDCLLKYENLETINQEIDVYENVLERLIICYIHFGNIKKAREYEEKFVKSVAKRIEYDSYAKYRLYKLYRKANALYNAELALIKMKESVSFFATKNITSNVKDFYIALTNMSCVLIENGEFAQAYTTALKGINLEEEYPHLNFPRTQIIRSNFCIAGILNNKMKLEDAINIIESILNQIPVIPERIFHVTNLSSLYALNNNLTQALDIVEREAEKQNYNDDIEGLYKYYIHYNKTVFQYLLGETTLLKNSVDNLEKMENQLSSMLDGGYMVKKNKLLIKTIQTGKKYSPIEWLHVFHNQKSTYQNRPLWKYHGLGYAFVSMNNWE